MFLYHRYRGFQVINTDKSVKSVEIKKAEQITPAENKYIFTISPTFIAASE